MRLSVNDVSVEVAGGASVLDAVKAAGAVVPTLCYDERLTPQGSCRVCLVGVKGRAMPACTTPAAQGMAVRTDDPAARRSAQLALELLVSQLPARALDVPADRSELVRACQHFGVTASRFDGATRNAGVDHSHPYVKLDRDLCIACNRCVRMCAEVQGTFALSLAGRGFDTLVVAGTGGPWMSSPCVACGGCVDTCPSGALSEPGLLDPRPISWTTTTTCGYCGVGCTLRVHVRDNEVAAITPVHAAPVNRGHACVKGRFAHAFTRSRDRLTTPLIRRGGRKSPLEPTSWDEALTVVATRLAAIRDRHGPDAIGMISSARATNEENYLAQKFARAVLGTNNVDNCSRLCHAPSAVGLTASFGYAGGTNSVDDLDGTDCILIAGANPTEAHPVIGARIKQLVLRGARLVVIDPRRIDLAEMADVYVQAKPGSNVAVFNGIARVLLDEGYADEEFLRTRASGLAELTDLLRDYPVDHAARVAGVQPETLTMAARLYGTARRPAIVYGLGITEHAHGTDGVRTLANLAILKGAVGTPGCCGVLSMRGQNNVQGASDMGALPDMLPGYQHITNADVRARFARHWGVSVPERPGLRILEMFEAAIAGRVRAMYVIGEDIAQTDPDSGNVRKALAACDLVVSHDLFLSRTAHLADVVFPAVSFLEKDGTFVNFDRRVQRVRPALTPPGQAKPDFDILQLLAHTMGAELGCPTPADALAECATLTPTFAGISHARLDRDGPLHWPCRAEDQPGEGRLYLDSFATHDGRAALAARPYLPPGEQPDAAFPYVLITGRRLVHYNSGSMSRRTPNMELRPREVLDLHPDDGARLRIADGNLVEVTSRRTAVTFSVHLTDTVAPGQLFTSFNFPDTPTNALTSDVAETVTGCPEYKVTAVSLRPV
ncbi:formate dehydrogenase subunit alpha [Micromonospora purpureochromogenes]|uniref:Formate dehydrogenase major subunit n=1 Tax=Micromonospora purpureochromogenes TaxID=47872 RepID=A0ABX2RUG6_9ACTN|nr:formate dehydrogenase subunit alpha [Micromonospora purpureochromogenes]NYF60006.1 formate dehydrogenase major subunit [Micromonospora purpureochromogenes]